MTGLPKVLCLDFVTGDTGRNFLTEWFPVKTLKPEPKDSKLPGSAGIIVPGGQLEAVCHFCKLWEMPGVEMVQYSPDAVLQNIQ